MKIKYTDRIGQKFGRLTIISIKTVKTKRSITTAKCSCDCGNEKEINIGSLIAGITSSCGCLHKESASMRNSRHCKTGTAEWNSWSTMKSRCLNIKSKDFERYGARGIGVDPSWSKSFECFFADMGEKPTQKHSIERIDNNAGYFPTNCKWALPKEQANNRRNNAVIEAFGHVKTLSQWADSTGLSKHILHSRIKKLKWPAEVAITKPVRKKSK